MTLRTCRPLGIAAVLAASIIASADVEASDSSPDSKPAESSAPSASSGEATIGLADALAGTSGVRVATMCTNCNVANVSMLGQADDRVQVWQDGLPVQGGLGAIYLLSVVPSQDIADTDIIRGAGSVLSGPEASVGAVLLRTRMPEKRPYIFLSLDGGSLRWASQKLVTSGRAGPLGGVLVVTHARSDPSDANPEGTIVPADPLFFARPTLLKGNYDLGAFERTTVGGTLTYTVSKRSMLRLDAISYDENQRGNKGGFFFNHFEDGVRTGFLREDVDILRRELGLSWDYAFADRSRILVRGRYSRRDQDTSDDFPGEHNPYMHVDEFVRLFDARYESTFFGRHRLTAGVDAKRLEVRGNTIKTSFLFPDGQRLDDFVRQKGVFAEVDLSLPARLDLVLGLRRDNFDWTPHLPPLPEFLWDFLPAWAGIPGREATKTLPRARLAWKATRELALSISAGAAAMAPAPGFERVCCGAMVFSNAFSDLETSRNYLLDADYVPWRWWKIRASIFRSDFDGYLQKMAVFMAPDFIPSFERVNYSDFSLEGADLSMEMRVLENRLSYGLEVTHLRKRNSGPITADLVPEGLGMQPIVLPDEMIPFLPKDQGAGFVKWDDEQRGVHASIQAQYTGTQYVQRIPQTGFFPPAFGQPFVKTPKFWVFNLRGECRIDRGLSAFVGIDNLTSAHQSNLDDPHFEYNWGPLRDRYIYAGLSFEM